MTTSTETAGGSEVPGAKTARFGLKSEVRECDWCHPGDLYRVDRRLHEWALGVLGLHPYVCCRCGARGLMFGRCYAVNWRWRKLRLRIVFRVSAIWPQQSSVVYDDQRSITAAAPRRGIGMPGSFPVHFVSVQGSRDSCWVATRSAKVTGE
jgi:hypothetical protein